MILSDVSVKRPVFAGVLSLLLIAFGLMAFERLSLREYPNIDPPIVTISTSYPGAAANVVETRITQLIEDRIAGIEGIQFMSSTSEDSRSRITIEFKVGRDVDAAANDIRDRVSGIADDLPVEADPPDIQKEDSNDDAIMWLNFVGEGMTTPELTDYAERYLVDRFSILDGVSSVRVGGQQRYAMRIWVDRNALAARNLTVSDIESALRSNNIELPAGTIESDQRQFTVRTKRTFHQPSDFGNLVIAQGQDSNGGYLVRLGDVARVEKGTVENRSFFRGNLVPQVGIGIIKQSTANTIEVARQAKEQAARINETLPEGMSLEQSYDRSIFIEGAIDEVYQTLFIAIALVVLVIYLFLGNVRAMLVPAVTVPVSVIATFSALALFNFSINLFTLLALVLAIGLVVDDAIVVLENISRRMEQYGESPLIAAYRGARQVAFAVVATTAVLVAVFVPIAFQQGNIGRLFSEFALTMAAAVVFSSFVALSLSTMLASKFLRNTDKSNVIVRAVDSAFGYLQSHYLNTVDHCIKHPLPIIVLFFSLVGTMAWLYHNTPEEYAPKEDRGAFFLIVNGPEGASYDYTKGYMEEIEQRLMSFVDNGEFQRLLVRAPRAFGTTQDFSGGLVIIVLEDWDQRRSAFTLMNEVRSKLSDLPGVRAFPVMRQGFGGGLSKPVSFVVGGGTYAELTQWRDVLMEKISESNPGLIGIDWDYKETKPQLEVDIDYTRAAELGVDIETIGRTLETMLGSRRVTTYIEGGEEYDVILEGERSQQRTIHNMENIYVRSTVSGQLIPLSNLVTINEFADSSRLNRFNRVRAITMEANLAEGYSLGEAINYLETLVREHLPTEVVMDYKGQSRDFKYAGASLITIFLLGLFVTYLVLAAQFESWVHPFVIMLCVPLAMVGGLAGLYFTGASLNIYSQIGLIMLVGLAAKNGILIVEFANQLRDEGVEFTQAIRESASTRLRPIAMTAITTAAGTLPLILSSGPGMETRAAIGLVVLTGVISATLFTLFVTPVAYSLLARHTGSPMSVTRELQDQHQTHPPHDLTDVDTTSLP
ncbi:efflux RND transporter permease subunit [Marinibactrum halimedae]|uniref:Multidrug transporter n=1 Tax=Marinibactrum halimedae TaxID=1444977 RepID=A0AA37T8E9_9GAMM|nr:efflux RND transporter permease subunit [Marinibactrum halimedae]MCD9460327.1 efflux RND transporter permease subunit [Marinibactrum halimedae]GLS26762.1 multidrug transporter [Marinibactrum halimedae]